MKKALALFLTLALGVSALTGCGGSSNTSSDSKESSSTSEETATSSDNSSGAETITFLSWYSEEQLGDFISAFETENPDIHVDLQYVPPVQQYVDKFSVLVASNQMTDLFYTAAENKQEVTEKQLAVDISDMEIFKRIDPATAGTYGNNGEIYAYSPDAWIGGIFYNKDLFEQAGITEEPKTWDEFLSACEKLNGIGVIPYVDDADNAHNLAQDLYQCMVISKDPEADAKINAGEATYAEIYTEPMQVWYNDMIASGLYNQISLGINADQVIDMFANGEVAMFHGGPWNVSTIEDKNPDMNYDIFGLSDKEGNRVMPGALNVGMSISTSSEHQDACRKFIEFMSRDENIVKWQSVSGNAIIADGVDYELGTVFEKFKDDAVNGNFYLPQIAWKNSSGIYKEFLAAVQDVITGADTAENIPVRLDAKQTELSQ